MALVSVVVAIGALHCNPDLSAPAQQQGPVPFAGSSGGGGGGSGSGGGCSAPMPPGPAPSTPVGKCAYTDDTSFCACLGMQDVDGGGTPFNCGGIDAPDTHGINQAAYCGACPAGQYCKNDHVGDNFGRCTPGNPVQYAYQRKKMDVLVSMGENDTQFFEYYSASNIGDGRGYTIGTIGFTTGTGDFIFVAACYNDAKPDNVLKKYWGTRDGSGRALNGLIYYNDVFTSTGANQCDTSLIDSLGNCSPDGGTNDAGMTCFAQDIVIASGDPAYVACADSLTSSFYLAPAAQHAQERGLKGALTLGFLYDTEINFGDDDDPVAMLPGTKTIMKRADVDYGSGLPTDFTGKPWEESRWLGFVIQERAVTMSKDMTWMQDMDQLGTWEAARRMHTGTSNNPESATDLSMDYDFSSAYKAGSTNSGTANTTSNICPGSTPLTPCWTNPPLKSLWDTCSTVYVLSTDKPGGTMDPTMWGATAVAMGGYASCPSNPTP
jgi:hypothetical protein